MAYSSNPHLPQVRRQAVQLVRSGWSIRKVARHLGFSHSAVIRWVKEAPPDGRKILATKSSRPHTHPKALTQEIVDAILTERLKRGRCAQVVHAELVRQGLTVSLSSVKRTITRCGLTKKRSKWKKQWVSIPRPPAQLPGSFVQVDTVHITTTGYQRFYVYTLIDVYSRWAWAQVVSRLGAQASVDFVAQAQAQAPFRFQTIQTDHGPEFTAHFTRALRVQGLVHRHSRVRRPNDNAHLERFNRTVQEECLSQATLKETAYQTALNTYLPYYNTERLHLGIDCQTPMQMVSRS